jgi:hypothetical protein
MPSRRRVLADPGVRGCRQAGNTAVRAAFKIAIESQTKSQIVTMKWYA